MIDPLSANERVLFNIMQRKIDEHQRRSADNLRRFVDVNIYSSGNTSNQIFTALWTQADIVIPLLKPFATKEIT